MLLIVVICVLCALLLKLYYDSVKNFKEIMAMPGPPLFPILGNVFQLGRNHAELLKNLNDFMYKNDKTIRIKVLNKFMLFSRDPKFMEFVLSSTKHITKSDEYKYSHPWLGNGLLVSTGNYWKSRRRALTPAFHFKILEQFVELFHNSTDILVQKLHETGGGLIDVYPYITRCTLDVMCETAMGTSVDAQNNTNSAYFKAIQCLCQVVLNRSFSTWKGFDCLFQFSQDYRDQAKSLELVHGFTRRVISQRRKEMANKVENNSIHKDDIGIKKKIAFLDILLTCNIDGVPLTDDDVREEVDTFMFEGHDTTASAIAFCLFEISRNQEVQNKILEELKTIFGEETNWVASYKNLSDMKYLELVLKETLRLYPSVPFFARELEEDTEYNGMILPKGISLFMFIYGMQRDPDIFPDPEKFNPDRFLSANQHKNPFVYVPFSAGPRNCIGQKFAMLEMKEVIAKVLWNFELDAAGPGHELILSSEAVMKSVNGVKLKIKPRKY